MHSYAGQRDLHIPGALIVNRSALRHSTSTIRSHLHGSAAQHVGTNVVVFLQSAASQLKYVIEQELGSGCHNATGFGARVVRAVRMVLRLHRLPPDPADTDVHVCRGICFKKVGSR